MNKNILSKKTTRKGVLFAISVLVGIGTLWAMTDNLQLAVLLYVVSSVVCAGALVGLLSLDKWIAKGEK